MTELDDELVPEIKEIIDELGKSMTFAVPSSESYDPTTGEVTRTTDPFEVVCSPPIDYEDRYIDGDLIKEGDVQIFIPTAELLFTPTLGMGVTIDAIEWTIINLRPIYTGELIGVYETRLRK